MNSNKINKTEKKITNQIFKHLASYKIMFSIIYS